jgi:hypothetical protein
MLISFFVVHRFYLVESRESSNYEILIALLITLTAALVILSEALISRIDQHRSSIASERYRAMAGYYMRRRITSLGLNGIRGYRVMTQAVRILSRSRSSTNTRWRILPRRPRVLYPRERMTRNKTFTIARACAQITCCRCIFNTPH